MPTITVDYCGVSGTGKNVTEAKKDATRRIEKALSGSYSPRMLTAGPYAVLIYRDPDGWRSVFCHDEQGFRESIIGGTCYDSLRDAEKSVRHHLAALMADCTKVFTAEDVDPVCTDSRDRHEIARDQHFQRAYRWLVANHPELPHHAVHSLAGWHSSKFATSCEPATPFTDADFAQFRE